MAWNDKELAEHLSASAASNEVDFVIDEMRVLALKHKWTESELEDIIALITKFRVMVLKNFVEFHEEMER